MSRRKPIGIGLLLVVAALLAMAVSASGAGASVCTKNMLCSGGGTGEKIRDDAATPPEGGGYGASILATNTTAAIRLLVKKEGTTAAENTTPKGYAFFGIQIGSNPTTEECKAAHETATGWVTFADFQHSTPSAVYSGISPGKFGAWPVSIRSDHCKENPGKVSISNVHIYFPALASTAIGTFNGTYSQPGEPCTGGGIKLNKAQPEVSVGTGLTAEVDNGAGAEAVICFVSSNNVLFPKTAPTWTPLEGSIWKD